MKKVDLGHHELWIYTPDVIVPKEGFPVLYVLDGNAYSWLIHEVMKLQIRNSKGTHVNPMVIVGISYKGEDVFFSKERTRDFTYLAHSGNQHPRGAQLAKDSGGILQFKEELIEITKYINSNYSIDPNHVGIYGHSLGGLFVCESMYMNDLLFTDYIAVSPSLWWNEHEIMKRERIFKDKSVLFCLEDVKSMKDPAIQYFNDCKEDGTISSRSKCKVYEEENHMSVVMTSLSDVLRFFSRR